MTKKQVHIEISRAFQSLGLLNPDDVKVGFETGKFHSGDYARYEDSSEWRPIEVVVGEIKQCKSAGRAPITRPELMVKKKEDQVAGTTFNFSEDSSQNKWDSCGMPNGARRGLLGFLKEIWMRF